MSTVAMAVLSYPGWNHSGHMSGSTWIWGPIMMIILIVGLSVGVWLVVRAVDARSGTVGPRTSGVERAREILAERYARGEIGSDEYTERLARLAGDAAAPHAPGR